MSASQLDVQVANIVALLLALDAATLNAVAEEHRVAVAVMADDNPARSFVAAGAEAFAIMAEARTKLDTITPPSLPASALVSPSDPVLLDPDHPRP